MGHRPVIYIRVDPAIHAAAKKHAAEVDMDLTHFVERAVERYLIDNFGFTPIERLRIP